MSNRITTLIMATFKYINKELNNMFMVVVGKMRQTYKESKDASIYGIVNHCLYNHEMEHVSIYVKLPIAIIVTVVTMIVIVRQANEKRYRAEQ